MEHQQSQRGVALVLVLILLGVGALIMGPSLRNTATALNFFAVSRESTDVVYALDAVTQQALWLLESSDPFEECDSEKAGDETFVECVAAYGSWDLATADYLVPAPTPNASLIDTVNGQQVIVTVEVPAPLGAAVEPTPTPTSDPCFYAWVSRDPTWVQVGEPIDYTLHVWNCSNSPSQKDLRFVAVITSRQMDYIEGSRGGSLVSPPIEPSPASGGDCVTIDTDTETIACPGYATDSLLLSWPSEDLPFGAGSNPTVKLAGGEGGTLAFQLTPTAWGIFYIDVVLCYFNVGDPCKAGSSQSTGKVAPIVSGMFNINGTGKGHAFGASSKLDSGGADLISEQPQ